MIPDPIIWTAVGYAMCAVMHAFLDDKSDYIDGYIDGLNMKEKLKHIDMKIEEANKDDAN